MPLVCFNTDKFQGELVNCSPEARRRADFNYKLNNLQKMGLSNEEIITVCRSDYFNTLCVENSAKTQTH